MLKKVASEIFGLFVDDGSFAFMILAWLLLAGLAIGKMPLPPDARSVLFVAGLLLILAGSTVRAAVKARR